MFKESFSQEHQLENREQHITREHDTVKYLRSRKASVSKKVTNVHKVFEEASLLCVRPRQKLRAALQTQDNFNGSGLSTELAVFVG